jgi:hypothetical protein
MPGVGFEPTIPVFERAATVISNKKPSVILIIKNAVAFGYESINRNAMKTGTRFVNL